MKILQQDFLLIDNTERVFDDRVFFLDKYKQQREKQHKV